MNCTNCSRLREQLEITRTQLRNAESSADLWRKEAVKNLRLDLTGVEATATFIDKWTGKKGTV